MAIDGDLLVIPINPERGSYRKPRDRSLFFFFFFSFNSGSRPGYTNTSPQRLNRPVCRVSYMERQALLETGVPASPQNRG